MKVNSIEEDFSVKVGYYTTKYSGIKINDETFIGIENFDSCENQFEIEYYFNEQPIKFESLNIIGKTIKNIKIDDKINSSDERTTNIFVDIFFDDNSNLEIQIKNWIEFNTFDDRSIICVIPFYLQN